MRSLLTRKVGLLVAFALWTFVLGVATAEPALVVATIPVAIYVVLVTLGEAPHLDIGLIRTLPKGQVFEGGDVTMSLEVTNNGPDIDLEVADEVPEGIDFVKGSNQIFLALKSGESRTFSYTFSSRLFGTYSFGPVRVRSSDRSTSRYEMKTIRSSGQVRIYPEVRYLSRIELRHNKPRNWPGETVTRRAGQGLEFYGIRDYASGDFLRNVNWKASARSKRLMLNQHMDEAGGEVVLVVDSRYVSNVGVPPDTAVAHSARAAAAIAYRMIRDRNRVGLLDVGHRLVKVPPGLGRRHFERILAGLISTEVDKETWGLEFVHYYLSLYFSRMVQVILISPLVDREPLRLVSELTRRGYDVLVIAPSAVAMDEPVRGDTKTLMLARKLAEMERRQKLSLLSERSMVVDWDPRRPLQDALTGLKESWRGRRLD